MHKTMDRDQASVETEAVCWVCSTRFAEGERVTRLPSLGIEVHASCADEVLRSERPREPREEDEGTAA